MYIGASTQDYGIMFAKDPENPPSYLATGLGGSIIPSRVSWFFDLHGEALYIDTACSSSLTCLHMATQNLRRGETSLAIVGGVNLILTPDTAFNSLSNMGFTSPDGRCYSFDARANGYAKGEGTGIVLIKRLNDALKDGNTIRAVIRATGTNQDGRTPGITQPSGTAQEANIRAIYDRHGLDKAETRFVEAHGTGTQIGDPIEAGAIARAFEPTSSMPLYIGAVKSNIGHLEAAAGVAGLIKVCMILEKGIIPPNALYETPNERIPINEWHIKFPTQPSPWPTHGLRRASLNSFGYGGTNAHAVLDDAYHYLKDNKLVGRHNTIAYPLQTHIKDLVKSHAGVDFGNHSSSETANGYIEMNNRRGKPLSTSRTVQKSRLRAFIWSASDEGGLSRMMTIYRNFIQKFDVETHGDAASFLQNLSHTLSNRRSSLPWKTYILAHTIEELQKKLVSGFAKPFRSSGTPCLAFIFTGQGAQWAGMGKELLCFPDFSQSLERSNACYKRLGCDYDLLEELAKEQDSSSIDDPLISQCLSTAVQLALVDLLAVWNIYPQAVLGHSSGEIAAAYCAGGLSFESALQVSYFRGYFARALSKNSKHRGGMIAVSLSHAECQAPMKDAMTATNGVLVVACENSPSSVTISGDKICVDQLSKLMESQGIFARRLNVPIAYHSPHMKTYTEQYQQAMNGISNRQDEEFLQSHKRRRPPVMFSSVTGGQIEIDVLAKPSYWTANSSSMVKFSPALQNMAKELCTQSPVAANFDASQLFTLEIGPHSALKRPIQNTLSSVPAVRSASYASLLERAESGDRTCLNAIAEMCCRGCVPDLDQVNNPGVSPMELKLLVDLPPYPFNHSQSYWSESRISRNYRFRPQPRHELCGIPSTDWNPLEPHWRHFIKMSENPWIKDHSIDGVNLYPAPGMIAMVIEAARQLASPAHTIVGYTLENLQFMAPLKVDDSDEGVEVQLRFHRPKHVVGGSSLQHDFSLFVSSNDAWAQCSRGLVNVHVEGTTQGPARNRYSALFTRHEKASMVCSNEIADEDFYNRMHMQGYQYGPAHQVLKNIRYSKTSRHACADIELDKWMTNAAGMSSPHVIHPTALDGLAQLAICSLSQAATIRFPTTVPVSCKSLWISNKLLSRPRNVTLEASVESTIQGFREVDFVAAACNEHGEAQIVVEGWRQMAVTSLAIQDATTDPRKLCYAIDWKTDIEQLTAADIRVVCDQSCTEANFAELPTDAYELVSLFYVSRAIKEAKAKGATLKGFGWHTRNFLKWAEGVYDESRFQNLMSTVSNGNQLLSGDAVREAYLDGLAEGNPDLALTLHVGRNLLPMMNSEADPLEIIYKSDLIDKVYSGPWTVRALTRVKAYFELLSHKNPNMKMIEIGAGTGSSTKFIMDAIAPRNIRDQRPSLPSFESYYYTDISPGFFEQAQAEFPEYPGRIQYAILNMEKDPEAQDFPVGTFDVVYCGLVLHALSNIERGLRNARKLLKPGGKLIILESTNPLSAKASFVWGFLPGWWLATEDFRQECPLIPASQWDRLLKDTGFAGVEACLPDEEDMERRIFEIFVTTAVEPPKLTTVSAPSSVKIICDFSEELQSTVALRIYDLASTSGSITLVDVADLQLHTSKDCHVIVLKELETPWLQNISADDFEAVTRMVTEASSVLWVTTGAGVVPTHPEQDLVSGFGRNVRSEQWDLIFTHLALERSDSADQIATWAYKIHVKLTNTPIEQCEDVIREKSGRLYIARISESATLNEHVYQRTVAQQPTETTLAKEKNRPLRLTIGSPGQLDSFHFADDELASASTSSSEIRVRVVAVGLTNEDLMISMGKFPAQNQAFGMQFAGTVEQAKPEAGFKQGDRVMGMTSKGAMRTVITTKTCLVLPINDNISFDAAAATPFPWTMAYYTLIMKANMRRSESILIHNAFSSVGQSAIQIAGSLQATIFATVNTEQEKRSLVDLYELEAEHIFSSQNDTFAYSIKNLTEGGVDVVLNSLTGRLMEASWSLVAPLGRFVEMGKSDLLLGRDLRAAQFLNDASFIAVDLGVVLSKAPQMIAQALTESFELHEAGVLRFPQVIQTYPLGKVEIAFRAMQADQMLGDVVVQVGNGEVPIQVRTAFTPTLTTRAAANHFRRSSLPSNLPINSNIMRHT